MIDGTYDVLVNTSRGEKRGTATLATEGDKVLVDVKIAGFPRRQGVGKVEGNSFSAEGCVKIPLLGSYEYRIVGSVTDGLLEAECDAGGHALIIAGIRR